MWRRIFALAMICAGATFTLTARGARAALPATSPAAAATTRPSDDPSAALVASFYRALLQAQPPTIEQEKSLFTETSSVQRWLVLGPPQRGEFPDTEPMKWAGDQARRDHQSSQKVAAAGPVVMQYFRRHKDWFLPIGMKSPEEIQVSSPFRFVRNVERMKGPPSTSDQLVIALFVRDRTARKGRFKAIVFNIVRGKIDPDAIYMDGFSGELSYVMIRDDLQRNQAGHP